MLSHASIDGQQGGTVQLCWAVVEPSPGPAAPDRATHHLLGHTALA